MVLVSWLNHRVKLAPWAEPITTGSRENSPSIESATSQSKVLCKLAKLMTISDLTVIALSRYFDIVIWLSLAMVSQLQIRFKSAHFLPPRVVKTSAATCSNSTKCMYMNMYEYIPLARSVTRAISSVWEVKRRHVIGAISALCVRTRIILIVAPMRCLCLTPKMTHFHVCDRVCLWARVEIRHQ